MRGRSLDSEVELMWPVDAVPALEREVRREKIICGRAGYVYTPWGLSAAEAIHGADITNTADSKHTKRTHREGKDTGLFSYRGHVSEN